MPGKKFGVIGQGNRCFEVVNTAIPHVEIAEELKAELWAYIESAAASLVNQPD